MSLEHSPIRQAGQSGTAAVTMPTACFTIDEFCRAHRLSRSMLYLLWEKGIGPRKMTIGTKVLISTEAAFDWRREREAAEAARPAEQGQSEEDR